MINSRIRVQYWMDNSIVAPSDSRLLYPSSSDIVSQVHLFDADWTDGLLDDLDSAWIFAHGVLSMAEDNFLSVGFSPLEFGLSMSSLRKDLSNRVAAKFAALAITYPNDIFNAIHVIFEADAVDNLKKPAASPPSLYPSIEYHDSNSAGKHQQAEFVVNLDQLRAQMGDHRFYACITPLHPMPGVAFAFADSTDDEVGALSVLQTLSVSFFRRMELPLMVTTDVYYLRAPGTSEAASLVEVERLLDYAPNANASFADPEDAWQGVRLSLEKSGDGTYQIHGQPYDRVMLWFQAVSLHPHSPDRPKIEVFGEVKPENVEILRPEVLQPSPFRSIDQFGQPFRAEGSGIAMIPPFSPSEVPGGNCRVFFVAYQNSSWSCAHVVNLVAPGAASVP